MANISRINYALQSFKVGGSLIGGVQSVGASSTTNIETFSAFGSTAAVPIVQDIDLEITVEAAMGGWPSPAKVWDSPVDVEIVYALSNGTFQTIKLNAVASSYSLQMGVDGPATESVTFQNTGTSTFTSGSASALHGGADCSVITRPDFTSFTANNKGDCDGAGASGPVTYGNVLSVGMSWDAGVEKVSILGQSLPAGKFATFPIEVTTEVETHAAGAPGLPNSQVITNNKAAGYRYDLAIALGSTTRGTTDAVMASSSIQGGDVGGGNVSESTSWTSYSSWY
jgi:hypothetical protein